MAAAPLIPGADRDQVTTFGLLVAFAWIPAASIASRFAYRRPGAAGDALALLADLVLLAMVQAFLAPSTNVLLAFVLLFTALATYKRGRWVGAAAGSVAVAVISTIASLSERVEHDVDPFTMVVFPAFLGLLAWLLDAVSADRSQASAGLVALHGKSDALLAGVGEAVVVTDERGRVTQWNPAATATFGNEPDQVRGQPCQHALGLLHEMRELDCSNGCALLCLGVEEAVSAVDVEVWRRSASGARQPLLASVSSVRDGSGEVVEVVHSYRDITRLRQADEAKTMFLATTSHELKTPLTVIRGFSQMLLLPEVVLSEDERLAALRAIDARAGQLSNIVDRLLMSSRIEAGRIELEPVGVEVGPILRDRVAGLEGATGREVVLIEDDDLPAAWCDADAFTTVVDHLLDNAVKYSPAGGPVTVSAASTASTIDIVVADEGIGMTAEQAEHCFDRFWQAEATDVRRFGGTGIGLYIVRSLVEGMGGSIAVTSSPGAGSAFRVVLARADAPSNTGGRAEPGRGEQSMIREYMRQLGLPVGRERVT